MLLQVLGLAISHRIVRYKNALSEKIELIAVAAQHSKVALGGALKFNFFLSHVSGALKFNRFELLVHHRCRRPVKTRLRLYTRH